MFRVIYRWEVAPENFEVFKKTWRATTNRIHASVPGALGSFMLKGHKNETEILTIAKWESYDAWQQFWGNANPEQMDDMSKLAKRISVEAYSEIEDHTH
ncbi:MAG: antibiotic biosynthesis monooxygenase [Candidatus Thiodiazotropha taylori]